MTYRPLSIMISIDIMEPHHLVWHFKCGFLILICDAMRIAYSIQHPQRWQRRAMTTFSYRMFCAQRLWKIECKQLFVRAVLFCCAQLFSFHLVLCLFVKFFRELFFVSFQFQLPPQNRIRPKFETIIIIRQIDWIVIAIMIRIAVSLLCVNKTFELSNYDSKSIFNINIAWNWNGRSLFMWACICVRF